MRIKVFNDGKLTFTGEHLEFLQINEGDPDVADMVDDAINNGSATRQFFSGEWTVEKDAGLTIWDAMKRRKS